MTDPTTRNNTKAAKTTYEVKQKKKVRRADNETFEHAIQMRASQKNNYFSLLLLDLVCGIGLAIYLDGRRIGQRAFHRCSPCVYSTFSMKFRLYRKRRFLNEFCGKVGVFVFSRGYLGEIETGKTKYRHVHLLLFCVSRGVSVSVSLVFVAYFEVCHEIRL